MEGFYSPPKQWMMDGFQVLSDFGKKIPGPRKPIRTKNLAIKSANAVMHCHQLFHRFWIWLLDVEQAEKKMGCKLGYKWINHQGYRVTGCFSSAWLSPYKKSPSLLGGSNMIKPRIVFVIHKPR